MTIEFPSIGHELSKTNNFLPVDDAKWDWFPVDDAICVCRFHSDELSSTVKIKYQEPPFP